MRRLSGGGSRADKDLNREIFGRSYKLLDWKLDI